MKTPKKILKKVRGTYKKKVSLTSLAEEYYGDEYCDSHRRFLFRKEIELKFGHHLTLEKRLKRRGYHHRRPLTPEMLSVIKERIGEPERCKK